MRDDVRRGSEPDLSVLLVAHPGWCGVHRGDLQAGSHERHRCWLGQRADGASIPRYLWSVMGGPFEGKYRKASVLHDVAYGEHKRHWKDCDRMFYYAMRCSGVGATESKTMYYALYKFGHHWRFPIKRGKPVKYEGALVARGEEIPRAIPVNPTEINQARNWISNTDPSLEQIEERAQTEAW